MADAAFEDARLAAVYDDLDGERDDLTAYLRIVDELGAGSVLDIGSGTGTFALMLAQRGIDVTAVDPAAASLAVARAKSGAHRVRWIRGTALALPPLQVDLVTMTGNVAQVFVRDDEWHATLCATRAALRAGGHFVFETRDPARKAWLGWNREQTYRRALVAEGAVQAWCELQDVNGTTVTFRWYFAFEANRVHLTSDTTLRFRDRAEVEASLDASGFHVEDVRDAPDRPGLELVFVARRRD